MSIVWTITMISIFCLGLREITDDVDGGRIGYPIRSWFVNNTPVWVMKPVIVCCACMSSFWGTIIYFLVAYYCNVDFKDARTYLLWVFSCVSSSYINTVMWVLRNKLIGL